MLFHAIHFGPLLLEKHSKANLRLWINQPRNLNMFEQVTFLNIFFFDLFLLFPHDVLQKKILVPCLQQINCTKTKCSIALIFQNLKHLF